MQNEFRRQSDKDANYEPSYKELMVMQLNEDWARLPDSLREIAEFAEIASEFVDHLRNE
jgi:hypothetical protein